MDYVRITKTDSGWLAEYRLGAMAGSKPCDTLIEAVIWAADQCYAHNGAPKRVSK